MADDSEMKIVIRHVSGAKANKVEEFALGDRSELRFGRAANSDVVFDAPTDDLVSRSHATISVASRDPLAFVIEDLGSANGTYLEGEKLSKKSEILPNDKVTLGRAGPAFVFDLHPRPTNLGARTRVIDVGGATRVISAADVAATAAALGRDATAPRAAEPPATRVSDNGSTRSDAPQGVKQGIGRETMLGAIAQERAASHRMLFTALGVVGALVAIGGGALFWRASTSEKAQQQTIDQVRLEAEEAREQGRRAEDKAAASKTQMGMSPQAIVQEAGSATAKLRVDWRLYDQKTGHPIFQKTRTVANKKYRMYVKLPDGSVVPYLTLDDGDRDNLPVHGQIEGTAFVVNEKGFLLTNKHLAAAWRLPFAKSGGVEKEGLLIEWTNRRKKNVKPVVIDLDDDAYSSLKKWVPETGGVVFAGKELRVVGPANIPTPTRNDKLNFTGRNEQIEVIFAGNTTGMMGTLVKSSNDADVAMIKIDSPQPLRAVEIATDDDLVSPGEHVVVLGYPAIAATVVAVSSTIENGVYRTNTEVVPQPYVTDGIVALVSTRMGVETESGVTYAGVEGNIMQLTINATGKGNSGGPVFDSRGKVIGIFSLLFTQGSTTNTAAVPIKYGRALLRSQ
jgi:serine protease Do